MRLVKLFLFPHYGCIMEHRPNDTNIYLYYYLKSRSLCRNIAYTAYKFWNLFSSLPPQVGWGETIEDETNFTKIGNQRCIIVSRSNKDNFHFAAGESKSILLEWFDNCAGMDKERTGKKRKLRCLLLKFKISVRKPGCAPNIKSSENLVDCASTGTRWSELRRHPLWWNGPQWLSEKSPQKGVECFSGASNRFNLVNHYSSFSKLAKVVAYLMWFYSRLNDVIAACMYEQSEFTEEFVAVKQNSQLEKKLWKLHPLIDHGLKVDYET